MESKEKQLKISKYYVKYSPQEIITHWISEYIIFREKLNIFSWLSLHY
jgi:hypothetical protein